MFVEFELQTDHDKVKALPAPPTVCNPVLAAADSTSSTDSDEGPSTSSQPPRKMWDFKRAYTGHLPPKVKGNRGDARCYNAVLNMISEVKGGFSVDEVNAANSVAKR